MPFSGYKDFDSCVLELSKKHGVESAKKMCARMQAMHEGSKRGK